MKQRHVGGKSEITSNGKIDIYSKGNITSFGQKINQTGDEKGVCFGQKPQKVVLETLDDDAVNVYVGMFFDGTGNNRFNSDSVYYTKLKGGQIEVKDIPSAMDHTVTVIDENHNMVRKTIKVTDRDSYWNPYSNVAKLFQLYKEKKSTAESKEYGKNLILKQYVEGIGTKEGEPDDVLGSGLARGSWGVLSRVEEGIEKVVKEQIVPNLGGKKINKIVFDVFGFSRGAAAARHFCNEVKSPASYSLEMKRDPYDPKGRIATGKRIISSHAGGYLGKVLHHNKVKPVKETFAIEIRFLGVFDTVVSDFIVKDNMGYKAGMIFGPLPIITQLSMPKIKTNVSGLDIGHVLHLVANDEWRENFAYTPTEVGHTIKMLGAHSDIGGGYAELDKYEAVVDFFDLTTRDKTSMAEKEKVRQFYINNYFSKPDEIQLLNIYDHYKQTKVQRYENSTRTYKVEVRTPGDYSHDNNAPQIYDPRKGPLIMDKVSDHYILKDTRYISNKYSLVPMQLMLEKAIEKEVPFCKDVQEAKALGLTISQEKEFELSSHSALIQYLNIMREAMNDKKAGYALPPDLFATLRNKYVHLSAHYGGLKNDYLDIKGGDHHWLGNMGFVNHPVKYTIKDGAAQYKRETYANE